MNLLLIAALAPPLFLLVTIYRMDKVESEPTGLIAKLVIFGALSCIPAAIIESVGQMILNTIHPGQTLLYHFITAFIIVAWAEEGVKHFVLRKLTWNHPAFDYHFDGVVYAVASSLGFAALENVMYVCLQSASVSAGLELAASRGLMSIPGHCIFGIFMGMYYSQAKQFDNYGDIENSRAAMKRSMFVPVLLHGFYDFCLFTQNSFFITIFFIFIVLLDIVAYKRIRQFAKQDSPL